MGSKMLVDASHAEETRVVVVRGNRIEEFDFESAARKQLKGNIYLAKVTRVEPSLQAAFVDYGGNRHGFLAFSEIHPDYYQIPVADRMALLREDEEDARRQNDEDGNGEEGEVHSDKAEREFNRSREEPANSDPASSESNDDGNGFAEGNGEPDDAVPAPQVEHGLPAEIGDGVETVTEDAESQKVESVGAEDALEEVPRRARRQQRRNYKIQEVIKRRQVILVQVVKEERGNKGAALTTYLSLAGRYCVLMPNTARGGGISRKITDASDRRRLKEVARDVEVPEGMGLIVRTAGAQRTKTEIKRDYDYLMRLWENVRDLTLQSTAPALVYEEGSLIKRAIRDLYNKDVEDVQVEGEDAYREAKDFMKMLMPSHARNVKLYKDTRPLFSRHQVETQLDSLFSQTVTLPSGGYMVINQTEALVSIDINSGKATREHNIEDTALKTNLEASDEIARQLRLRDLAGLVVIDFIDMEEKRNNRSVERRLKEALKNDRARIQVGRISHFGLLEMSRQRLRPSLLEGSTRVCPHCEGRGMIRSVSSCALSVLRAIEEQLIGRKAESLTVKCSREIAFYILNEKRDNLLLIENAYGISIFIVATDEVKGSQSVIERAIDRVVPLRRIQNAVKIESAYEETPEAEPEAEDVAEAEEVSEARSSESGRGEGTEEDGARRRGRRRRGRRGSQRGGPEREAGSMPSAETLPGLGDQPDLAEGDRPLTDDQPSPEGEAPRETRGGRDDERRGGRRDRWGRRRGSDREDRPNPSEAAAHSGNGMMVESENVATASDEAETMLPVEHEARPEERYTPPAEQYAPPPPPPPPSPAVAEAAPETTESRQPRHWQPPAPTVAEKPVKPKAGWWSKRS
ncbi:hypothetical protein BH10PSE7_BH10PSE7_02210 [soil metagenome]